MTCKCGCGEPVRPRRSFVDKLHQLSWMNAGGAREMGALQPLDAKQRGGEISGRLAVQTGRLQEAATKGGERSRALAAQWRAMQITDSTS